MQELVRVAVDAMGGDNAPLEIVMGAVEALELRKDLKVILVGPEETVRAELKKYSYDEARVEVGNASEVIEMADTATLFSVPKDKRTEDYITGRFG